MKNAILLILSALLMGACQSPVSQPKASSLSPQQQALATDLLSFFEEHAYQAESGAYLSELDNEGKALSTKVFNVALSRLIYGLSYASKWDEAYLDKAEAAVQFQLTQIVAENAGSKYFLPFRSETAIDSSTVLDIWQQAYGLCGLTEFYRHRPDPDLLAQIHELHAAFVHRFQDSVRGGFYVNYDTEERKQFDKSLQSLMYPITAYMENLWMADTAHREQYESILRENVAIAYEKVWNPETGWVNITFEEDWQVCSHSSEAEPCFTVSPGHNFQFASLLLRTYRWDFLSESDKQKYQRLGKEILQRTLKQAIYPEPDLSQGFYSQVNPLTHEVLDDRKTWWQHCEALVALSLAGEDFETEQEVLLDFFAQHFSDAIHRGEYFYLDANNQPQTDELKGSVGKSAYHTIEMLRFVEESK